MPPFEKQQPGTPTPATRHLLLAGGSIILITLLAYANSFSGPFVFDDVHSPKPWARLKRLCGSILPLARRGKTLLPCVRNSKPRVDAPKQGASQGTS